MGKKHKHKKFSKAIADDRKVIEQLIDGDGDCGKTEKYKHKRAVRRTKVLFRAIDILYAVAQNNCPYLSKKDIENIETKRDLVYDSALPDVCRFDFYRPKTDGKLPIIVVIHGGGFTAGDKKYRRGRAQFFAANGYCVFSVNYGLAPEYIFPTPLAQLVCAVNYIYDNADEFGGDRDRIIVCGDSAGGYYAAMLAAFNSSQALAETFGFAPKFRIFGAVFNCGVYDIKTVMNTKYPLNIDKGVLLSLTGIPPTHFERYKYRKVCVPIEHISAGYPPTFLSYSDYDTFCKGQGNVMLETLERNGVYCEYYSAHSDTSNHCYSLMWRGEDACAANQLLLSFVKRLTSDKIKL